MNCVQSLLSASLFCLISLKLFLIILNQKEILIKNINKFENNVSALNNFIEGGLNSRLRSVSLFTNISSDSTILSRKKRYILFPDGSTFTAAVCSTQTVIGSDTGTAEYTESFVWALVYDLPSTVKEFGLMKKRKRRDVYDTMAQLLNRANIKGEDCILKSICEIENTIQPKIGVLEEILRLFFTIPKAEEHLMEHEKYMEAQNMGKNYENCDERYPHCQISLLQMFLGLQVESVEIKR